MMTREEHLEWSKERAREYLDQGDVANGIASMFSDLNKHEETRLNGTNILLRLGMMHVTNNDIAGARHFIDGFR